MHDAAPEPDAPQGDQNRIPGLAVRAHTRRMVTSYEQALAVQRRHEQRLLALPGVSAVGVKLREERLVLEVSLDPAQDVPAELDVGQLDGIPLVVERRRYEPQ
jgi:hypothetical protein